MYDIRLKNHISRAAYNRFRDGFSHKLDLLTEYRLQRLVDRLAEAMEPVAYDCCIDSCVLFVGPHKDLTNCPICKKDRYLDTDRRTPRQTFLYIPVIPRL